MSGNELPSTPAAPAAATAAVPSAAPPAGSPAATVVDDDLPATTMTNLFKQKASPIRFFVVILVWAIGVLIVGIDTKRRTNPPRGPTNDVPPAAAAPATASSPSSPSSNR
jgi:hypothetical protein